MTKVVLNVPERTAERLQSATPMELETVSMVLDALLAEPSDTERNHAVSGVLTAIQQLGEEAERNGLTPEKLETILGTTIRHML